MDMTRSAAHTAQSSKPVLIFDVMDTIVKDPFFHAMPRFFQMSFKDLLAAKHPTAWVEFELGHISEDQLLAKFFQDGRSVDGVGLVEAMVAAYDYIEGMPELLARLQAAGYDMHLMSNYPLWYKNIENKLQLSRYGLSWSFISCEGPMQGTRKPAPEAYQAVSTTLNTPGSNMLFVDDRQVNVDAALAFGMDAVRFESAAQLEEQLRARGLQF